MRNLKKFLALVLAMMMTLSLMVTVNAATTATSDFTDGDSITKEFREGVAVLEGLGVFTGYTNGDKFDFRPKNNITRAEVATIVYRLATGDVEGNQAHLYKDYATFTDVKSDHWAAGYINYCANAEWIAGYGNGKFGPNDNVTGYQAAAMILRAVGYGKNDEFTGPTWQVQVANFTRTLNLLYNVNETTYKSTLNQPATRELVAEILFQAGLIPTVTWTPLNGYQTGDNSIQGMGAVSGLAWQNFRLRVNGWDIIDEWGNPGYTWTYKDGTAATIEAVPDWEFKNTVHECDVAEKLGIKTQENFQLYLNGPYTDSAGNEHTFVTSKYLIVATDTVTKVGGQGRLTKFYKTLTHPWSDRYTGLNSWPASVTMVDTFLAQVTNVSKVVLDPAGHVMVPAKLTLTIYDRAGGNSRVVSMPTTSTDNWEYNKGDMVLLKANTTNHSGTEDIKNRAAFETETVVTDPLEQGTNAWVLGVAKSKVAKQTTVYWNQGKHCVDGVDIPDQIELFLNVAGTTTNSNFTWYFDGDGDDANIIGIGPAIKSSYGVITSIYTTLNQGDTSTDGTSKAIAKVKLADGSEDTYVIDRFLVGAVPTSGDAAGGHTSIVKFGTKLANGGANTLELRPVYDYNQNTNTWPGAMQSSADKTSGTAPVWNGYAVAWAELNVAPVASVNASAENGANGSGYFGIIKGNLFKFITGEDDQMVAIEVAGKHDMDPADHTAQENTGIYEWNYNSVTNGARKLLKNAAYFDLDANETIRVDGETKIIVKDANTNDLTVYDGTDALPGDVSVATTVEVDWADPDGDGTADVLYVTGTMDGTITYGLFYYNGGAGQWNGVDKKGTLTGYLGAEPKTLEFDNLDEFNIVKNSQAYGGHLFGVQMTNGVVTNLMGRVSAANDKAWILSNGTTLGTAVPHTDIPVSGLGLNDGITGGVLSAPTGNQFVCGVTGGNSYRSIVNGDGAARATRAIWIVDNGADDAALTYDRNVVYDRSRNEIVVYSDWPTSVAPASMVVARYSLNGAKIVGDDLEYLNTSNKNDITIVFENTASGATEINAALEVYVTTYRNVTPGDNSTVTYTAGTFNTTTKQVTVTRKVGGVATAPDAASPVTVTYTVKNANGAVVPGSGTWVWNNGSGDNWTFDFSTMMPAGAHQEYTATVTFDDSDTVLTFGPYYVH